MSSKNNTNRLQPKRGKVDNATSKIFSQLFIKTNLDLCIIGALIAFYYNDCLLTSNAQQFEEGEYPLPQNGTQTSPNDQAMYAMLFPWFAQTITVFIYYAISRYLKVLPYTAIVFLFGVIIGVLTKPTLVANREYNAISYSTAIWLKIDGLVILLVFLPGLIFNDSYTINVHMFFQCKGDCNPLYAIDLYICSFLTFFLISSMSSILAIDYFCVSNGKAKDN
jgi:hypothetical protein